MVVGPGTRVGPYEIAAQIGSGGMGEVYRARDTRLGRDVAIKVLPAEFASDPERLRRFEQEAKAVAALDHPNILAIHDVGTHEGAPYIVTELLEGENLRDRLAGGAIPVRKAVEIAVQIAQGLSAAHEKGIVHRDLKPGNVFVTQDGHVKLLDFGIAKLLPPRTPRPAQATTVLEATEAGMVLGTVGYMSPEQVRGQAADPRSDIFSLGCVLYEMLAGRAPFFRPTGPETASAILTEDPVPLSASGRPIAPALQEIVGRCLEKRPEERFSSAHDLALALRAESGAVAALAAGRTSTTRRTRSLALAVAAVVVVAIAVGVALWRPWRAASAPVASGHAHLPSILALPCKVYGAPEVAFLTDAVPGTISTLLAQVEGLDTKVPPSSLEVDKLKGDVAKIAGAFQVENLVLTTLTANGDRMVLNAQLVEAGSRRVRWGKQYEGVRGDFNELARQAAEGVRQAVSPVSAPVPTAALSGEVELAFREGKYFLNNYKNRLQKADFDLALKAFTMALERDPTFARAAGEIARLYNARFQTVAEGEKDQELLRIGSWARRALDLDPHCGEAWDALAWVESYTGGTYVEDGLKAARYAPRDAGAHITFSVMLQGPGSVSCALVTAQHARELDPLETQAAYRVAFGLFNLGKPQEALLAIDQALALEPDSTVLLPLKSLILTRLGRFAEAADALRRSEPPPAEVDRVEFWRLVRLDLALAEDDAATVKSLEGPLFKLVSGERSGVCVPCYLLKASYVIAPRLAHVGRKDDALRILLRAVEAGFQPSYDWLLLEPDIQLLRGDARFAKVLTGSRDGAAIIARVLGQARARGELPSYLNQPLDDLINLLKRNRGTS